MNLYLAAYLVVSLLLVWGCFRYMRQARDRARNALTLATEQAARVTLLDAERRLLEAALADRDSRLGDVRRELEALRAVLREEEVPVGDVRRRLAAFSALEDLVRLGYGPSFTQGAIHTSGSLVVFGPNAESFADAILRTYSTRRPATTLTIQGIDPTIRPEELVAAVKPA